MISPMADTRPPDESIPNANRPPVPPTPTGPQSMTFKQFMIYSVVIGIIGIVSSLATSFGTASKVLAGVLQGPEATKQIKERVATAASRETFAPRVGEIRAFAFGGNEGMRQLRDAGWLDCAGQDLDNEKYPLLHRAIGETWGTSSLGNRFYAPDLRGMFLRGWQNGGSTDELRGDKDAGERKPPASNGTGASGNKVGSIQPDMIRSHAHPLSPPSLTYNAGDGRRGDIAAPTYAPNNKLIGDVVVTSKSPENGSETRPKNAYVLYCMYVGQAVLPDTPDGNGNTYR
jgi:hypothetical protein